MKRMFSLFTLLLRTYWLRLHTLKILYFRNNSVDEAPSPLYSSTPTLLSILVSHAAVKQYPWLSNLEVIASPAFCSRLRSHVKGWQMHFLTLSKWALRFLVRASINRYLNLNFSLSGSSSQATVTFKAAEAVQYCFYMTEAHPFLDVWKPAVP